MNAGAWAAIIAAMAALVAGQLLFKLGMRETTGPRIRRGRAAALVACGVASMTLWFLLWLGLLQGQELSKVFPFEGLATLMLSVCAAAFLRERLGPRGWIGVVLVACGVIMAGSGETILEWVRTITSR